MSIANNLAKWQTITAEQPQVATQKKYFQENIGGAQTIDQFVNNPRLFNYAMTAFGLGDMTYAKGLMKEVLQQGVSSSAALANTLNNPDILAFAKAFDFADNGSSTTSSSSLQSTVVNNYVMNTLETNQGQQDPGVQLALYFQQNAPNVTNVYGILADKNLLTVVQTALGISPDTSAEPIDTQAALLGDKLNIADFQNPAKLQSFIERFAAMYDASNASSTSSSYTASNAPNALLLGASNVASGGTQGIDPTLLLSAQNLNAAGSFLL
jgi:hypothetical protein